MCRLHLAALVKQIVEVQENRMELKFGMPDKNVGVWFLNAKIPIAFDASLFTPQTILLMINEVM